MPLPRTVARMNRYVANPILGRFATFIPLAGVVHHVGRTSGNKYSTPVNVFRDGESYVIALTYTSNSDWVKNVLAAGGCDLETRGKMVRLEHPVLETDKVKPWAPWPVRKALGLVDVNEVLRLESGSATENPPL